MKRVQKYPGVYFRESAKRKVNGQSDRCFYITYKDPSGKKIWEKVGWTSEGYTAAMASQLRAERVRAVRHGDELPRQKKKEPYFGELARKYIEWARTNKKSWRDDEQRYRTHLKPYLTDRKLSQISPFLLEKLKRKLADEGLADATVKHCLVLVRQMYNKALAWGLWKGENPVKGVKLPSLNNSRVRFLSHEEARLLLDELRNVSTQTYEISLLSLNTGMRAGEIFNLRWQDIDIENGLIHVADPKSGRSRKAYMTEMVKEMFAAKQRGNPDEHVFKDRNGNKIRKVSRAFHRTVDRLGFNDGITDPRQRVTFHTLRHTFASWLAILGTPIHTIKELLGHQTLGMTERYSHLIPENKIEAIAGLEQRFISDRKVVDIKATG